MDPIRPPDVDPPKAAVDAQRADLETTDVRSTPTEPRTRRKPTAPRRKSKVQKARRKAKPRPKVVSLTAKGADRYALYEASVQSPEADIAFAKRVFRRHFGRLPLLLREDFCGTGLLACAWAASRADRRALGVDLDPTPLEYGERRHRAPLGEAAKRVQLVRADVRELRRPKADVTMALNFSYNCFQHRAELLSYLRSARTSLAAEGLLILDVFGGTESMEILEEENEKEGFQYVWDQEDFDPVSHRMKARIHFRFPDGTALNRAFSYDWRLWTTPEILDCLREVGFQEPEVWWEGFDEDGDGDGRYRRVRRGEPCEGFVSYLTARR